MSDTKTPRTDALLEGMDRKHLNDEAGSFVLIGHAQQLEMELAEANFALTGAVAEVSQLQQFIANASTEREALRNALRNSNSALSILSADMPPHRQGSVNTQLAINYAVLAKSPLLVPTNSDPPCILGRGECTDLACPIHGYVEPLTGPSVATVSEDEILRRALLKSAKVVAPRVVGRLDFATSYGDNLAAWCNFMRPALVGMMEAYERRVRSECTPEQLAAKPWECMEYVAAQQALAMQPLVFVDCTPEENKQ